MNPPPDRGSQGSNAWAGSAREVAWPVPVVERAMPSPNPADRPINRRRFSPPSGRVGCLRARRWEGCVSGPLRRRVRQRSKPGQRAAIRCPVRYRVVGGAAAGWAANTTKSVAAFVRRTRDQGPRAAKTIARIPVCRRASSARVPVARVGRRPDDAAPLPGSSIVVLPAVNPAAWPGEPSQRHLWSAIRRDSGCGGPACGG